MEAWGQHLKVPVAALRHQVDDVRLVLSARKEGFQHFLEAWQLFLKDDELLFGGHVCSHTLDDLVKNGWNDGTLNLVVAFRVAVLQLLQIDECSVWVILTRHRGLDQLTDLVEEFIVVEHSHDLFVI